MIFRKTQGLKIEEIIRFELFVRLTKRDKFTVFYWWRLVKILNREINGLSGRCTPVGSNALHCCQRYGARANDISIINFGLINRYVFYR